MAVTTIQGSLRSGLRSENHFTNFVQFKHRQMTCPILANPHARTLLWLLLHVIHEGLNDGILLCQSEGWRSWVDLHDDFVRNIRQREDDAAGLLDEVVSRGPRDDILSAA